jgi:hypothetical protein
MDDNERQAIVDEEHLNLLRIGYMVSAGMCALFSFFGLFYILIGAVFFVAGSRFPSQPGQEPPPAFVGWLLAFFGLGFAVVMLGLAALRFRVAQLLKRRRSRIFCLVVAGICCLEMPYGTLLGVMTFLVLGRPSVSQLFTTAAPNTMQG